MIRIGNKVVAGSADVDLSTVLKSLNKTGLSVWIGTQTEYDALAESVKNNEKITFIIYDTDEDVYLIVDTIISYGKTWSSVKISSELAKKINAADVYTKEQVDEIIASKLASALKYKGAVNTTALLPASAENGDSYFVKADGFMYAYNSAEADWDALGTVADMTNYFTKAEITAILQDKADKFQYDVLPTPSSETVGLLLQYTGADTQDYKNGYWYKGVDNGDDTYSWIVYTDDKYALSIYSNDLQLTYDGSSYLTTSDVITQLTSDIVARKHSDGTVGGNISITWTGKSCITGSYSIHNSGAGFVILDFENDQNGKNHCTYNISNGSAVGISWSKLATTDSLIRVTENEYQLQVGGDNYAWFDLGTSPNTDNTQAYLFYEITYGRVDGLQSKILVSCGGTMANGNYFKIVDLSNTQTGASEQFKIDSNKHLWLGMQSYCEAHIKVYGRWSGLGGKTTVEPTGTILPIYKITTTNYIYKTVSTNSLTSAGTYHWFIVDNLYPSTGLKTATYIINGRNGGCYIMSCGTSDDVSKVAPTITTISSGSGPLVGFNYDLATGKVELQSNQYNTLFITQISGVRNDFTIKNETNTPQLSTVGVMESIATKSNSPYKVYDNFSNESTQLSFNMESGAHYECKVYYYGGLCGIYDLVMDQFGSNGGWISTVWEHSTFKFFAISVEQSTGAVSMAGTAADNVQFVIYRLP